MIRWLAALLSLLFLSQASAQFSFVQANHGRCLNGAYVGDSLTTGFGNTNPYPAAIATKLGSTSSNQGVGGAGWSKLGNAGVANLTTRAAAEVDPLLVSLRCSGTYVYPFLVLWGGRNDICDGVMSTGAATYAFFQTYISARLAAGWAPEQILVLPVIPSGDPSTGCSASSQGAQVTIYNNDLIAGAATYGYKMIRLDQDVNIGCNNCQTNATYFQADFVHLTNTTDDVVANLTCLQMRIPSNMCPAY